LSGSAWQDAKTLPRCRLAMLSVMVESSYPGSANASLVQDPIPFSRRVLPWSPWECSLRKPNGSFARLVLSCILMTAAVGCSFKESAVPTASSTAAKSIAARSSLSDAVTVTLADKRVVEETGRSGLVLDEKLTIAFTYRNNTDRDIAGVKGTVTVQDIFGERLSSFAISNDDNLKAGGTSIWRGERSIRYSLGRNQDSKLAGLSPDKYAVKWDPEVIVFADGTKLEKPSEQTSTIPASPPSPPFGMTQWPFGVTASVVAAIVMLLIAFLATRYGSQIHGFLLRGEPGSHASSSATRFMGLVGSAILLIGVFTPIVSMPLIGSVNMFGNGRSLGGIVSVLAVASGALAFLNRNRLILLTSVAAGGIVLFAFLHLNSALSMIQVQLADGMKGNPFAGLANLAVSSVQLQWGWAVMAAGIVTLLLSGARPTSAIPSPRAVAMTLEERRPAAGAGGLPPPVLRSRATDSHVPSKPAAPSSFDRTAFAAEFSRLAKLRRDGALTEEEFRVQKAALMAKSKH
jgi:hypothetical protein